MAFSTTILQPVKPQHIQGGFDFAMENYTDATGATYKVGALLIGSGGDLVEGSSFTSTGGTLVGVAMQPGSNITGTHVANSVGNAGVQTPLLYTPAFSEMVFTANIGSNDADYTPTQADVWVKYGLSRDSTSGYWYVDANRTTTNAACIVIGFANPSDIVLGTTVSPRVQFKFLAGATAY